MTSKLKRLSHLIPGVFTEITQLEEKKKKKKQVLDFLLITSKKKITTTNPKDKLQKLEENIKTVNIKVQIKLN